MNTYINFAIFITTTIVYYLFFKPTLLLSNTINSNEVQKYTTTNYYYTFIYFMAILAGQLVTNIFTIIWKCGSSSFSNLLLALLFTILPWTLIFGVMLVILLLYPSMKKGFSDVVGYLVISGKAHEYIDEIIKLDNTITSKIFGKPEIFINVLTPFNFNSYLNDLTSKNTSSLQSSQENGPIIFNNDKINQIKNDLFNLIVNKDNIGEIMWIIYTGILLISIVQYYITSKSCANDKLTMQDNYKKYIAQQAENKKVQDNKTTTYKTV